jgi:hypothetical protein
MEKRQLLSGVRPPVHSSATVALLLLLQVLYHLTVFDSLSCRTRGTGGFPVSRCPQWTRKMQRTTPGGLVGGHSVQPRGRTTRSSDRVGVLVTTCAAILLHTTSMQGKLQPANGTLKCSTRYPHGPCSNAYAHGDAGQGWFVQEHGCRCCFAQRLDHCIRADVCTSRHVCSISGSGSGKGQQRCSQC